jgi:predicted flap endonuclease-1-like 5' DNA nuclease
MTYLLAKFTVLFLLTALLGFVLGYWFSRRKFVDVSESYEDLREASSRSDTAQWEKLWERLDSMPAPKETDLTTVTRKLDNVEQAVRNIPKPAPEREVDLRPVTAQLNGLEQRFARIPQPQNVDLAPIDRRLTAIEAELGMLSKRLTRRTTTEHAPRKANRDGPQILSAALYGNKDDLKLISGVGPKLENLLNENGVFYFWQVAEWNARDIDVIDERLDAFKGRIARDDWVTQAKQLRRTPDAASMPAG